jgi:hypothetical protein
MPLPAIRALEITAPLSSFPIIVLSHCEACSAAARHQKHVQGGVGFSFLPLALLRHYCVSSTITLELFFLLFD